MTFQLILMSPNGIPAQAVSPTPSTKIAATAEDPFERAYNVLFISGAVGATETFNVFKAWCVRGGMNADRY